MKPLVVAALFLGQVLVSFSSAQQTSLQLEQTPAKQARLTILGEPGYHYRLESCPNPTPLGPWDFRATFSLDGSSQSWLDSWSMNQPQLFYRAVKLPPPEGSVVSDFRLIDQTGRSRWLYYYFGAPAVRAVVLIFTGNGCAKLWQLVPTIKSLTNQFAPQGVLFWLVDSNAEDTRADILQEAIHLGMSNGPPILHDSAQLVARSYGASTATEAVLIDMSNFQIAYRGTIDDRVGSEAPPTAQRYLANAISAVLSRGPVSPRETRLDGCPITLRPAYSEVAYASDIAPILQAKCVRCHSPGNIAPWYMTNHLIVQLNAGHIRDEVMAGRMPPWHADPAMGTYVNDASLTTDEAAKLIQWLDAGALRGTGPDPLADAPSVTTNFPVAWPSALGQPDAILRIQPETIPATGTINYRYRTVTNTAFNSDVWLRAAVVRPGNGRVVHHSLVFEGDPSAMANGLAGFYAGYVPGVEPAPFPDGTGKLLKKGQVLTFQMHYTSVGTVETDQTELGLYLAPVPPERRLQTKAAANTGLFIPANAADYQATAQYPLSGNLTTNIMLYEMSPHMHLRGSRFKFEIIYPAGNRETLLSVPNYIFHWQTLYRLTVPKYIPRGARILCTANWDNTAQNVELKEAYDDSGNPAYLPSQSVGFGEQSWDEMLIGYLNFTEVPGP